MARKQIRAQQRRFNFRSLQAKLTWEVKQELYSMMGFRPHLLQKVFAQSTAKYRILCCGRRWGKSVICSGELLAAAAVGGHCWVVAPNYDLASVIYEDCVKLATNSDYRYLLASEPKMAKGDQQLVTVTGGRISAKSSEKPASLLGRGNDLIVFDEASKESDPTVLNQYLSPTIADHEGSYILASTPTGKDWFYELWMRGQQKEPNFESWQFPSSSNPYFNPDIIEEQRGILDAETFRQEYLAQFLADAGGIFPDIESRMYAIPQHDPIPGHHYVAGIDLGRKHDFTVITIIDLTLNAVVYAVRFNQTDWPTQSDRIIYELNRWRSPAFIDSTGIGDPIIGFLLERAHVEIYGYQFNHATKTHLVRQLAIGIADTEGLALLHKEAIIEEGVRIGAIFMAELQAYQYKKSASGLLIMGAPSGKYDDCVMSVALAWGAAMGYSGQGAPLAVPDPRFAKADV
jgi:hypothetical protein